MTSTPFTPGARSTDGHPDVAEISALNEELLPSDRATELRAHLADCRLCADVLVSLEELRDALGTLPAAAPMPEDIAGRIDAALAAEALLGSSAASSAGDGFAVSRETGELSSGGPARDDWTHGGWAQDDGTHDERYGQAAPEAAPSHRRKASRVSRETGASRRVADRPAGRPGGATGPGRHRPTRRTRRWRSVLLVGAGALALGLGGLIVQSVSDGSPGTGPGKNKPATAGTALEKHVHGLLAEHASQQPTTGTGSTPSQDVKTEGTRTPSPLTGSATAVPSCVRKGIDRTDEALAVDEKMAYKGGHAYLVVLPHHGDRQRVDAYVVDPSCVSGEKSGPADVLGRHTYARR